MRLQYTIIMNIYNNNQNNAIKQITPHFTAQC
nr:MAG TPA: hypothetical protein [Microviridae sp.]